jgi:hypothetical protein
LDELAALFPPKEGTMSNSQHGDFGTPEYWTWANMIQRCENPNHPRFDWYGGRGIEVCERWHTYKNFLADMGRRPSDKQSIDRINNDGNYEPKNCRWATVKEQINTRSKTRQTWLAKYMK